jgi:acetyl esterase/lipase
VNNSFDIHPDFRSIKARTLSLERWVLALMRYLLALVNVLHRRKYKAIVSRQRIAGPGGHRIPVQIIRPGNLEAPCAALIYFHGGAFVIKHAPQHLENAVRYAREAGCCVVFVEYRLAPVHRFPAGFDDCHAALHWALSNADALGIDTRRIAVGGDSAGGALAAAVAQRARHEDGIELCGQLLIYPVADVACTRPSTSAFTDVPPFKAASLAALWDAYFKDPLAAGVPRYASPIHGELSGLAPAYVETAEFDVLHDQGHAYAQALIASGVDVVRNDIKGAVHGFDLLAAGSEVSKAAVQSRIQFLRRIFAG